MNISTNWTGCHKWKVPTMCHVYSIQIFSKQMPSLYEWSFQTGSEYLKINMRNSFLKLNHPFRKNQYRTKHLSYIRPAIWNRIPEIIKKTRNLNTFKHKMKHYYLNDLGRLDYASAIITNICLFVKQIFLHTYSSFLFFSCFTLTEGPQWK